jgi:hypothetical protein
MLYTAMVMMVVSAQSLKLCSRRVVIATGVVVGLSTAAHAAEKVRCFVIAQF